MPSSSETSDYQASLAAEAKKWGDHLTVEASGQWNAWLDHPLVAEHYRRRALVDGLAWPEWVRKELSGPAGRSLDLGCGSGGRSRAVFEDGASMFVEGVDVSGDRIAEAERMRRELAIPGSFRVDDSNASGLPADAYDLIFSCHSFHHFLELEHIMEQVHEALTPRGVFVLEEFVGPTQFQWTDEQIDVVASLLRLVPDRLRTFRWGATKIAEGRPTPAEVAAVSPFESIRSGEICALFGKYFNVAAVRRLGGTLQHLFYNGIVHNFRTDDPEALKYLQAVWEVEDSLVDLDVLPSDFMLLIGRRRDSSAAA